MKKIRMRSLRATLFLLLAVLFAVLAVLEAIPKAQTEGYIQATPFRVTSSPNAVGGYTYYVEGSIKNQYETKKFLDGIAVCIMNTNGDTEVMELEVGDIASGEVRKLSGSLDALAPAGKVTGVSTSVLAGDQKIPVPADNFEITLETIAFAALSLLSLVLSLIFFLRRSHHHHRSSKA